jgi:glycosyltransferase involved in cell wall biosynthesis
MYNLCTHLPKNRYKVITASSELGKYSWNNLGAYDREYNVDCDAIRLPIRTNRTRDRVMFFFLTVLRGLLLSPKSDSILVVYPDEFSLFAAYLLRLFTRKPIVIYMHDLYSELRIRARFYGIYSSFEKKIFSSAWTILVTNEKFREHYLKRGFKNVTVFHSCVVPGDELSIYQKDQILDGRLRIVYTGSVYGANDDSILCFLEAAKKVTNIEVVFSTPDKTDYLKDVSLGFLSKKECHDLQRSADVLFLPLSFKHWLREEIECAFPTKILEYLAAGKPVLAVVPKGSFVEEFVKEYDVGLVVTELSVSKIVDAIEQLKDKEKRLHFSRNALKTAVLFDAQVQSDRLCQILDRVVQSTC